MVPTADVIIVAIGPLDCFQLVLTDVGYPVVRIAYPDFGSLVIQIPAIDSAIVGHFDSPARWHERLGGCGDSLVSLAV
jgi:hypothetical protein